MRRSEAIALRRIIEQAAASLDDATALEGVTLFPRWQEGIAVSVGDRYQYEGTLYACAQAHTTQADWPPDITPALWRVVSVEEWPAWIQPTGAQDAYAKGDKVSYNGKHWVSDVDANVWAPGVYGWSEA